MPYNLLVEIILIPLIVALFTGSIVLIFDYANKTFSWKNAVNWSVGALVITLLIFFDIMGSTPILKSGFLEERNLLISISKKDCIGCSLCVQVCPKNCFDIDTDKHLVHITRYPLCVQCGVCIVQCPVDALFFKSPNNGKLTAEIIRKYKLNMVGKRMKKV